MISQSENVKIWKLRKCSPINNVSNYTLCEVGTVASKKNYKWHFFSHFGDTVLGRIPFGTEWISKKKLKCSIDTLTLLPTITSESKIQFNQIFSTDIQYTF